MQRQHYLRLLKDNEAVLAFVILVIAFGIGGVVRFQFVSDVSYPINDGGLFYQMAEDLLDNGMRMPQYTTYNNAQIPYAYPPLAFYLVGLLKIASRQTLLELFRIVPLALCLLIILAFYAFARRLFSDRIKAALSVLFFALLPRTFEWFIMGGGVTRGLGFLFAILSLSFIWEIFRREAKWINIAGAILCSAACILSHPETALFVIFMAGVLFFFHRAGWSNVKSALVVAAGVIALCLPWIITVTSYHGLDPFLKAGGTGHGEWLEIKNFLTLNFGIENEMFLPITSVLALIALFLKRDKLTYYLSASIVMGYFLFPRSGPNFLTLLIAPLAAAGFYELSVLSGKEQHQGGDFTAALETGIKPRLILIFLIVYLSLGAFSFKFIAKRDQLIMTDDLLEVYSWLDGNAGQDDKIMFYPAAGAGRFWWNDFASEWFPALTSKANLTTVQGYEWKAGEYQNRVADYLELVTCTDIGPVCVESWESNHNLAIDYLVIGQAPARQDFVGHFTRQGEYRIVFSGEDYLVLEKE